jgi:hypothetical protein
MARFWRSFFLNRAQNRVISATVWGQTTIHIKQQQEWQKQQPWRWAKTAAVVVAGAEAVVTVANVVFHVCQK